MSVASDVAERNGSHVTWALKKCDFYSESNQEPLHGFNQRRDIRICGLNVGCTKAVDLKHPAPPAPPTVSDTTRGCNSARRKISLGGSGEMQW